MSELVVETAEEIREKNRVMLFKLLLIVPVMLMFCASLVPLYKQVCEALGITATRAVAQNSQVDLSRLVKVEFVANLNQNFAWRFAPVEKRIELHPGAMATIHYRVTNLMDHATTGQAVPSFGPAEAGQYFNKIECFCFSNQTLQAGETKDMPVTFYVSPTLPKDIENIALSYTFFDVSKLGKS